MLIGPSPDGFFSWRFLKQFSYFATLCTVTLTAPFWFSFSFNETAAVLVITLLDEIELPMMISFYHYLIMRLPMLSHETREGLFEGLRFLLRRGQPLMTAIRDDLICRTLLVSPYKYLSVFTVRHFSLGLGVINLVISTLYRMITLPFEQPSLSPSYQRKKIYAIDNKLKSNAIKMAASAELKSIEMDINESSEIKAYALFDQNKIRINRGLINALKTPNNISAVIAHEIGHLKRSLIDNVMNDSSYYLTRILKVFGALLLPTPAAGYGLGLLAIANISECGISQGEEERADRMACHLVEEPTTVEKGLVRVFEAAQENQHKNRLETYNPFPLVASRCVTMLFGSATHPTDEARLSAVRDEINKIVESKPQKLS